MSPALPYLLASVLIGAGLYGVLARRHAVLMLIGVELILAGAGLILVSTGVFDPDGFASGMVLTMFVITIAAAEIVLALAVLMALYRIRGHVDLQRSGATDLISADAVDPPPGGVAE
ncbi:MAG: NADH-quinone oxidoreductase subunit NuoK [Ornithinimicrobium sp.]